MSARERVCVQIWSASAISPYRTTDRLSRHRPAGLAVGAFTTSLAAESLTSTADCFRDGGRRTGRHRSDCVRQTADIVRTA